MRNGAEERSESGAGLSDADLRLIFQLASLSERGCAPAFPRADEVSRAAALAGKGLLAMFEGIDAAHVRRASYAVTTAGLELFNRLSARHVRRVHAA